MIVDGKALAQLREEKVKARVETFISRGITPKIVSVVADESPETQLYVDLKRKAAERVGISIREKPLDTPFVTPGVAEAVAAVCRDESVHGVWVQLPLPESLDVFEVLLAIAPAKDVDCLNPVNLGRLLFPEVTLMPATVRAVMTILSSEKVELSGKRVVIVGSSPWLGKPLSLVLSHAGATVTMVWETETNLSELTQQADVLISAVGRPKLITADMVRNGAVVIDVGVSELNGKVVGDVDFEAVKDKASLIIPVPGGVGPVTVVSLLENCVDLIGKLGG